MSQISTYQFNFRLVKLLNKTSFQITKSTSQIRYTTNIHDHLLVYDTKGFEITYNKFEDFERNPENGIDL